MSKQTELGVEENIAAMLSYLLGWISGLIIFLIEKNNRFVRFHALQSLIFFGGLNIAMVIFQSVPGIGRMLSNLLGIIWLVFMIIGAVKSYQRELYKFPVAGDIAAGKISH